MGAVVPVLEVGPEGIDGALVFAEGLLAGGEIGLEVSDLLLEAGDGLDIVESLCDGVLRGVGFEGVEVE